MRFATWNVNSVRARLAYLLEWLEARKPDVVCLQELKLPTEAFPYGALEEAGYRAVVHGQPRWNGVAILSRSPIELLQSGLPGAEPAGARLVAGQASGIDFVSVYVPNGKHIHHADYRLKLDWLRLLADYVGARLAAEPRLVVAGDFNVTAADIDSHDPVALCGLIHHSAEERAALGELAALGLVDLFRAAHPTEPGFSWWDYRAGSFHRNLGLRIDLLLASSPLAERVRDVWVDRDFRRKRGELVASDHAPVVVDLDPAEGGRPAGSPAPPESPQA